MKIAAASGVAPGEILEGGTMRLGAKTEALVRREFFPEDCAAALDTLKRWRTKDCAPGEAGGRT